MNGLTYQRFLVLLAAICFSGCGTNRFQQEVETEQAAVKLAKQTVDGRYALVTTAELKKMLDSGEKFLLVDAMPTADSYAKGHIRGAANFVFPKAVMEGWKDDVMGGRTQQEFEQLLGKEKDRKIVFYCGFVKCSRSHNGAICAQELGYTNVYRYPGGIYAWRGAGNGLTTD